jgi:hypothetical protein
MNENDPSPGDVQGEGDYQAARRYDRAQREFVRSGRLDPAARGAHPTTAQEASDLRQAEEEGRSHSKGEDPLLEPPEKTPGR